MPASAARVAAFQILLRVDQEQSYASDLLHSARGAKLSSADRRLATELVMGVLRWKSLLDHQVEEVSAQKLSRLDPEVLTALRLAAYQFLFLSRVPTRAAIFESVELVKSARKRSAAPFVNAVLRKVAKAERREFPAEISQGADFAALAANSAHPEWLVSRWVTSYGFEAARRICIHDQTVPSTAIRLSNTDVEKEIIAEGIRLAPGRLLSDARTISSGDIAAARAYRERRVWIQDEASQLVALLVGQGRKILDCCAAPGNKSAFIAARNPEGMVVASELHPHRARLLRKLAERPNVRIIAADTRHLPLPGGFDRVLADVPCSGTGTLARNPEIKWRLTPEDLDDLRSRQIAILRAALAQLAPGGRMIYSTCSLEREENEAVVETVLAETSGSAVVDCRGELQHLKESGELSWEDLDSLLGGPYLRTLPGVHPCDGFFAAIIERRNT